MYEFQVPEGLKDLLLNIPEGEHRAKSSNEDRIVREENRVVVNVMGVLCDVPSDCSILLSADLSIFECNIYFNGSKQDKVIRQFIDNPSVIVDEITRLINNIIAQNKPT